MAKTSPYLTSPFFELSANTFTEDFHQLLPDLFDDLPSICSDIQKIESEPFTPYGSGTDKDYDIKPEVRNTDLMWCTSPPSSLLSTSTSHLSTDITSCASLADVMGDSTTAAQNPVTLQIKVEKEELIAPTVVTAKKINSPLQFKQEEFINVKQEPMDDVEEQLAHHSIPNRNPIPIEHYNTASVQPYPIWIQGSPNATSPTMQSVPPGASLLRKSQQQNPCSTISPNKREEQRVPNAKAACNNFASKTTAPIEHNNTTTRIYQRPDTPNSLDETAPEFKHSVDLRACVMGSNNISLTTDQDFIKNVTQELQDTSKKQIDTRLVSNCSLADVLDVINSSTNSQNYVTLKGTSNVLTPSTTCSSQDFNYLSTTASMRSSEFYTDEESSRASMSDIETTYGVGGVSPVSSQSSNIGSAQHYMQHRDHSYTRCKDGIDDLSNSLETPSDSEEEIDVVSINDKKLPTNPSDKDRRVLQTKVAHKFNAARIVKNPNGIRTIPPRRDSYDQFLYTPATSSPFKSVNNSRFPSPAATPYQNQYTTKYVQQQQQIKTVLVTDSTRNNLNSANKSRKRVLANATKNSNLLSSSNLSSAVSSVVSVPPVKKLRGKTAKNMVTATQLPDATKRRCSADADADAVVKRNVHNDMERQRRVGLKQLFDSLKLEIPSIKDKERAPKVNILREAAKYCSNLDYQERQLMVEKAKLKEQLRQSQEQLAARRRLD